MTRIDRENADARHDRTHRSPNSAPGTGWSWASCCWRWRSSCPASSCCGSASPRWSSAPCRCCCGTPASGSGRSRSLVFLALALVCGLCRQPAHGRPRRRDPTSRCSTGAATQLVGRIATLTEPINDGRGRVRIGDTMWRVAGPDLPAGAQVRVRSAADRIPIWNWWSRPALNLNGARGSRPRRSCSRSWKWTMPTGFSSSTTISALMWCSLSSRIAAPASVCGLTVFGLRVMMSSTGGLGQVAVEVAGKVAVGDDADQPAVPVDDADAAEALLGQHHRSHRGICVPSADRPASRRRCA